MDIYKYQLSTLCFLLLPLSIAGQEWSKQDSLRLKNLLESDQEVNINKGFVDQVEQGMSKGNKSFMDFDSELPTIKSPMAFPKFTFNANNLIRQSSSILSPNYSLFKINKNFTLHSRSNFAKSSDYFHIQTTMEYKFSKRWSLSMYGTQNLDMRQYRGLPSEIEPTQLGSNVVFKVNKYWSIKTGIQFQHNIIRKKWEWIPQVSVSFEW